MNVIIEVYQGLMETPILVEDDDTALAVYRNIAEKYVKDIPKHLISGEQIAEYVENYQIGMNYELKWFCDLDVNTYKSE